MPKLNLYPLLQVPPDVKAAIEKSIYAYLCVYEKARLVPLAASMCFDLHDNCIVKQFHILADTPVWAFRHQKWTYSEYRRVFDEEYPAPGADIFDHGSDWTLVCLVEGMLATKYVFGAKYNPPHKIGKVGTMWQDF